MALRSNAESAGWAGAHAALADLYTDCTAERKPDEQAATDSTWVDLRKRKGT